MRTDFQTRLRDDFPRRQFDDFASEDDSEDNRRRDKSFANKLCSVRVTNDIGPPVPGNRFSLDAPLITRQDPPSPHELLAGFFCFKFQKRWVH